MSHEEFLSRVEARAPMADEATVERITQAVLTSLGECLGRREASALADELPPELAVHLVRAAHDKNYDLLTMTERVALRLNTRPGMAIEFVAAVGLSLAELVSDEVLAPIRLALPENIARLLAPVDPPTLPTRVHIDPAHHDLAEGRPGSSRPLASADPGTAHSESVARSDNPHRDTKLSSATGLTQEREGESLATARH